MSSELNPQPLPPAERAELNPQPLPPGRAALLQVSQLQRHGPIIMGLIFNPAERAE